MSIVKQSWLALSSSTNSFQKLEEWIQKALGGSSRSMQIKTSLLNWSRHEKWQNILNTSFNTKDQEKLKFRESRSLARSLEFFFCGI